MPETMKLLKSTEKKISNNENGENVIHLKINKVILINCNVVNINYQQNSKLLYAFVLDKLLVQLLEISPTNFMFLKAFNLIHSFHIVK